VIDAVALLVPEQGAEVLVNGRLPATSLRMRSRIAYIDAASPSGRAGIDEQ
jgi:hypothetical protein